MAKNLGYELLMLFETVITRRLNSLMDSFVLDEVISVFMTTQIVCLYTVDLFVDRTILEEY